MAEMIMPITADLVERITESMRRFGEALAELWAACRRAFGQAFRYLARALGIPGPHPGWKAVHRERKAHRRYLRNVLLRERQHRVQRRG